MPFKLRKVPKKDLYWVVDDKGKHYSKEGLPKDRAKEQMKALYAAEGRGEMKGKGKDCGCGGGSKDLEAMAEHYSGAGILDFAKKLISKGKDVVRNVLHVSDKGLRKDLPPKARATLRKYANWNIMGITIRRDPIQSALNTALNAISIGAWERMKKVLNYDNLFHLGLEMDVRLGKRTVRLLLEKNEVINLGPLKARDNDTEVMRVDMKGQQRRLDDFIEKARQAMGDRFIPYDPFYNNCQDFILGVLRANNMATENEATFIKQPVEKLIQGIPEFTPKVAKAVTDLGGLVNNVLEGEGKLDMKSGMFHRPIKPLTGGRISAYTERRLAQMKEYGKMTPEQRAEADKAAQAEIERRYASAAERKSKFEERDAWNAEMKRRRESGFAPVVDALVKAGDIGVKYIAPVVGVPKVVTEAYKAFAPRGSEFYEGGAKEGEKPVMKWIEALKEWNKGKSKWCVPRKGSADYDEVHALRFPKKVAPTPEVEKLSNKDQLLLTNVKDVWKRLHKYDTDGLTLTDAKFLNKYYNNPYTVSVATKGDNFENYKQSFKDEMCEGAMYYTLAANLDEGKLKDEKLSPTAMNIVLNFKPPANMRKYFYDNKCGIKKGLSEQEIHMIKLLFGDVPSAADTGSNARNIPEAMLEIEPETWKKDFETFIKDVIDKGEKYKVDYSTNALIMTFALLTIMSNYKTECAIYLQPREYRVIDDSPFTEGVDFGRWFQKTFGNINNYKGQIGYRIKDCVDRGAKIVVIPFSITEHANMMIYRPKNNTFEHYEPHGAYFKGQPTPMIKKIVEQFRSFIPFWERLGFIPAGAKFIPSNEICPNPKGLQAYESDQKKTMGLTAKDVGGGFCMMWSLFYLEMCLKYPEISGEQLNKKAIEELQKFGINGFVRHIINYTEEINNQINKYFNENLNVPSKDFSKKMQKDRPFQKKIYNIIKDKVNEYLTKNTVNTVETDDALIKMIENKLTETQEKIKTLGSSAKNKKQIKLLVDEQDDLRRTLNAVIREQTRKQTGSGRSDIITMKKSDFIKEHKKLIKLFEKVTAEGKEQKNELKKLTGKGKKKQEIVFRSLEPSDRKGKKWMVNLTVDGKHRVVHFGAAKMSDYTIHKDEKRKERYIDRHREREDWTKSGILTPGFWAKHLLWAKPSLNASLADIRKRFKI
jgi:hypothetical protein